MDSPPLLYLLRHAAGVRVSFEAPWALLLAAVVAVFLWRRGRLGGWSLALRVAAVLALVAVLAGVRLTAPLPDRRATYVVAVDTSGSIDATGRDWGRRWVEELAQSVGPEDEVGILTFAGDVRIVRAPGPPAPVREMPPAPTQTATDLARAIDTAVALFPADGEQRLVLITDGHETRGNSRGLLPRLRAAGVRVDALIPPLDSGPDLAIEKLAAAPLVVQGQSFPLRVVVSNSGKPRPAVFSLRLNGLLVESTAVEVPLGTTSFTIPYAVHEVGSHRLQAELAAEGDVFSANNAREVPLMVGSAPRALIISAHERSALARALERKDIRVDVRRPERAPRSADELLPYRGVIAEDLTAAQVGPAFFDAVQQYVHDHGGGFVFVGGVNSFGDERLKNTLLRRLLPVTLEPRRPRRTQREPLALFLVIDRSNSMGYNSRIGTLRDGEKLRYAKEAALAVIGQLKDHDVVGVIAFDSQPWEISPLRPLRENRKQLEADIPRLIENGGTDFYDALVSARRQLEESRVNRRHIILLTDGDTNRADMDEYDRLLDDMVAARISITTVRIGDDTVNLKLLHSISGRTGGEFHHVADAQMLPDLMLRDTTRALGPVHADDDRFYPQVGDRHQLLTGINPKSIPPLTGYAFARTKPGADVVLHVPRPDRRDPILAVWQHGLGRVAAFTASPVEDAEMWLAWDAFSKLWSQLIYWTARGQGVLDHAVEARRREGGVELTVRAFGAIAPDGLVRGRLDLGDAVHDVSFLPRRPREFTARLPDIPSGRFPLTLIRRTSGQRVAEHTELVTIPAETSEPQEEQRREEPNRALLSTLTEGTGGTIDAGVRELVRRNPGTRRLAHPLEWPLVPLAMLLFLADVAVRRLSIRR
jgi:Ca-activated chloride channel family protein